ncbi:AAA family ATPase [Acanthopleuribacter pedis]|uniref:ATP-binding protein n=1 Tax=Acanthopleuribacter pedis TaxID=442870 RepID=A0A8J7Q2Z8_9BACT|nr:ATP-binding protein [Acanthopleuribacter pedis]MBO1317172.1 ATP-binding protein [Acanthopleuribacter pedis]
MNVHRNPFSAGSWVVGPHFFGRKTMIDQLVHSNENCEWVIGKRRVGKTSLLREIERRFNQEPGDKFALFWDIQGSYDEEGLTDSLIDALEDSQDQYPDRWEAVGETDVEEDAPCYQILKKLMRRFQRNQFNLVLLIDEAEEFITIGKKNPVFLGKLRKFFQNNQRVRTIITSTPRLEQIHKEVVIDTSPFLHGFNANYLGHFNQEAASELLRSGLTDEQAIHEIIVRTNGNPYETQLFAKHFFENPDLEEVLPQLEANPSLIQVIEVNFDLLSEEEQDVVKDVFCGKNHLAEFEAPSEKIMVSKLLQLGFLSLATENQLQIGSYFHTQWLSAKFDASPSFHAPQKSDPIVDAGQFHLTLQQILTLYKFFLEIGQDGFRCLNSPEIFKVSAIDQSIYPDRTRLQLAQRNQNLLPWQSALTDLADFLRGFQQEERSWTLFRLFQLVEQELDQHNESDFLDLMMLISEEAGLK